MIRQFVTQFVIAPPVALSGAALRHLSMGPRQYRSGGIIAALGFNFAK
jgi:hypothetical protein